MPEPQKENVAPNPAVHEYHHDIDQDNNSTEYLDIDLSAHDQHVWDQDPYESARPASSSRNTPTITTPDPTSRTSHNPPSTPNTSRRRTENLNKQQLYSVNSLPPNLNIHTKFHGRNVSLDTTDWHPEGPGRRLAYDDFSSIDWIFEYARERQRLRFILSHSKGLFGFLRRAWDASTIWLVLIATGVFTGVLAASIDVASDWLGDLKTGYCAAEHGKGGMQWFYLNKVFCCWGLDEWAFCRDWHPWSEAVGVSSRGGSWMVGYVFFVALSILFAVCASLLVKHFAPDSKQSGIPEIKTVLGGFIMRQFMSPWVLLIKCLGLCLTVASGLWLGKEGPLVHVACCCADLFLRFFPTLNENEARKREVLSAAAAAGISVAFGAPVGGVLFSLEQLSHYFPDNTMFHSFATALLAAVTLQAFNPFRTGKLVLYQVTYTSSWHAFELVPFALLGVLGGLSGALFIRLNMAVARFRHRTRWIADYPIREVVGVAILTALINYPNKFMRAQSTELVATLFSECSELTDEQLGLCGQAPAPAVVAGLLSASLLGLLLASLTFGLRIPAGIILPSLAIGALYGRAVGLLIRSFQSAHPTWLLFSTCEPDVPCVTAGTYAIIGAAAALGGATRMTVSIVVIMFELTGALTYVLPIMVSVLISKWVGDAFGPKGIYEAWISLNGFPFLDSRSEDAASAPGAVGWAGAPVPDDTPAAAVMTVLDELVAIPAQGHTVASLEDLVADAPFRGYPVVSSLEDPVLLGYVARADLAHALATSPVEAGTPVLFKRDRLADPGEILDLRPWIDQTPITLNERASLQLATTLFLRLGVRIVIFVARGRLSGLLSKKDVWRLLEGVVGHGGEYGFERGSPASRDGYDAVEYDAEDEERSEIRHEEAGGDGWERWSGVGSAEDEDDDMRRRSGDDA